MPTVASRPFKGVPNLAVTALTLALTLTLAGCGTVKTSGTVRTATEQLLLTNAWDSALQKVDFRPLTGVPVHLDTTNVTAVDQGWVVSSLKQAMLEQGVLLRQKPEQAQWVVEARVGAYGTDAYNWLLGVPQVTVPPTFSGIPTGTVPEIPVIKKSDQQGVAKLALFAYDRGSGQLVWSSGTMVAIATAKDVHVLGVGPIQSGTIRGGTEFVGVRLPIPSELGPSDSVPAGGAVGRPPQGRLQEFRHSAAYSDADAFAP
jgi:RNase P/RNase MRP subunit POP5